MSEDVNVLWPLEEEPGEGTGFGDECLVFYDEAFAGPATDLELPAIEGESTPGDLFSWLPATPALASNCEAAKDRLLAQFKEKPIIEEVLCLFGDAAQLVEQTLADIAAYRGLDTAFGAQLDAVGAILGLERGDLTEAVYRDRLRVKGMVVGSKGTPAEMLAILVALDDGFAASALSITESFPAAVVLTAQVPEGEQLTGEAFGAMLRLAKPAGVKAILEFEETNVDLFEWDGSLTGAGWGVGVWAEAV